MLCLSLLRWLPSRELSTIGCFPELFFHNFCGVGACGVRKFIKQMF